jgi:hypothetical protein
MKHSFPFVYSEREGEVVAERELEESVCQEM